MYGRRGEWGGVEIRNEREGGNEVGRKLYTIVSDFLSFLVSFSGFPF